MENVKELEEYYTPNANNYNENYKTMNYLPDYYNFDGENHALVYRPGGYNMRKLVYGKYHYQFHDSYLETEEEEEERWARVFADPEHTKSDTHYERVKHLQVYHNVIEEEVATKAINMEDAITRVSGYDKTNDEQIFTNDHRWHYFPDLEKARILSTASMIDGNPTVKRGVNLFRYLPFPTLTTELCSMYSCIPYRENNPKKRYMRAADGHIMTYGELHPIMFDKEAVDQEFYENKGENNCPSPTMYSNRYINIKTDGRHTSFDLPVHRFSEMFLPNNAPSKCIEFGTMHYEIDYDEPVLCEVRYGEALEATTSAKFTAEVMNAPVPCQTYEQLVRVHEYLYDKVCFYHSTYVPMGSSYRTNAKKEEYTKEFKYIPKWDNYDRFNDGLITFTQFYNNTVEIMYGKGNTTYFDNPCLDLVAVCDYLYDASVVNKPDSEEHEHGSSWRFKDLEVINWRNLKKPDYIDLSYGAENIVVGYDDTRNTELLLPVIQHSGRRYKKYAYKMVNKAIHIKGGAYFTNKSECIATYLQAVMEFFNEHPELEIIENPKLHLLGKGLDPRIVKEFRKRLSKKDYGLELYVIETTNEEHFELTDVYIDGENYHKREGKKETDLSLFENILKEVLSLGEKAYEEPKKEPPKRFFRMSPKVQVAAVTEGAKKFDPTQYTDWSRLSGEGSEW